MAEWNELWNLQNVEGKLFPKFDTPWGTSDSLNGIYTQEYWLLADLIIGLWLYYCQASLIGPHWVQESIASKP